MNDDLALAHWLAQMQHPDPAHIELGLERLNHVLPRLALRHNPLTFTIAGTNGKGTVSAMLAEGLARAGKRVGLYTSPHLDRFNERIVVDAQPVESLQLVQALERVERARQGVALTYFEYATLAALVSFDDCDVDARVLEVGLGGRLDAVNAVEPDVCVLTNVALDHQRWLGDTLEQIGAEKAAIFRPGKPAICAVAAPPDSVLAAAARCGAKLSLASQAYSWRRDGARHWRWLSGVHSIEGLPWFDAAQSANAAAVLMALKSVDLLASLSQDDIATLVQCRPPGRLESLDASRQILLDVCHNPASVARLADHLQQLPVNGEITLVFGAMRDKQIGLMLESLVPWVRRWIAVAANGGRAMPADVLAASMSQLSVRPALVGGSPWQGFQRARELTPESGCVVVAGSFPVVGQVRARLYCGAWKEQ